MTNSRTVYYTRNTGAYLKLCVEATLYEYYANTSAPTGKQRHQNNSNITIPNSILQINKFTNRKKNTSKEKNIISTTAKQQHYHCF